MPASILVATKEKKWLKKIIEEKFQLDITDSYSCKRLSELLSKDLNLEINYNTIRRIFEVVKTKNNPSIYSLNLLSKSIDFKDFEAFKKYIYKFDNDIFNEFIHLSLERKKIDHQLMMEFAKELTTPTWEQIYQLKNIIDLCIQIQDFYFLKQVIHLNYDIKNEEFLEKFTVCFQKLYFETKNKNSAVNNFILQHIATSEILQRILLQVYVSEDYLNDFWGDWLEAASVDLVYDMEVFKSVLLCQKKYNKNLIKEAKQLFVIAKKAVLNAEQNIHPILLGRIAAWDKILNANSHHPPLYFNQITSSFDQACYFVFYYRLINIYQKVAIQKGILASIDLKKLPSTLGAFDKKLLNKFYLTSSLYYHHLAEFEKAKTTLLKVDEHRLDVWEIDWFYKNFKLLSEIYN
jgi:hypothetical protein